MPDMVAGRPTATTDARRARGLTRAQVETFYEQGYLTDLLAFDAAGVAENLADLEEIARRVAPASLVAGTYCQERCQPLLYRMASHPPVLDCVEDLLGPDFYLWCSHVVCKEPGDPRGYTWHQDVVVAPIAFAESHAVPAHVPVSVTAWIALDDSDRENGALEVVPRSHTRGIVGHVDTPWGDEGDMAPTLPDGTYDPSEAVVLEMEAGRMGLFHDRLFHGSGPNRTTRRRAGLALHFSRPEARVDLAVWPKMKVRVVRGVDRFGHQPSWTEFEPGPVELV